MILFTPTIPFTIVLTTDNLPTSLKGGKKRQRSNSIENRATKT